MVNNNSEYTEISLHHYDKFIKFKFGTNEVSLNDMFDALTGLLVAAGWYQESIYQTMKDYADERIQQIE